MSYFSKPILLMFIGGPGAGKSHFSRAAAGELNAVRLNSDAMRLSIFGSRQEQERIYATGDRAVLNGYVFGALNYVTEQLLASGIDVVYDANHNKRSDRTELEALAAKYGAKAILVWIKTPPEVALKRGQTREESHESRKFTEEKMREVMERMKANTDEPQDDELVIVIDGQTPFEDQFASFKQQMEALEAAHA